MDSYFELNEDPVMQSMFRRMRDKNHLVDNFTDGVDRVKNRFDLFLISTDVIIICSEGQSLLHRPYNERREFSLVTFLLKHSLYGNYNACYQR